MHVNSMKKLKYADGTIRNMTITIIKTKSFTLHNLFCKFTGNKNNPLLAKFILIESILNNYHYNYKTKLAK